MDMIADYKRRKRRCLGCGMTHRGLDKLEVSDEYVLLKGDNRMNDQNNSE